MKKCISVMLAILLVCSSFAAAPLRVNAETMTSSASFISILKKIEGFAQYPYWDYSQWTVGYGTECPDDKLDYYKQHGITVAEAEQLLRDELPEYESAVNWFAQEYGLALSQNQFDALVSFTYNCGTSWVDEYDGYFNRAIREGKGSSAILYAMCLWSSAGGEYILIKRRLSEANMYLNGVYEAYNDSTDGTYPATFKYVYLDGNGGTSRYTIHGYDAADPVGVTTDFKTIPSGKLPDGSAFAYEFAGWFTQRVGGDEIKSLDGTLPDGTVLYAQWKDPDGEIVTLPKGEIIQPLQVTVSETVNIRSGPGTFYSVLGQFSGGEVITITQTFTQNGTVWGEFDRGWVSLSYTNYFDLIWPKTGKVNGTGVNVRSGPGTDYSKLYQLNTGDAVTIHERQYGSGLYWGRLSDGNWICLDYVTFDPYVPPADGDKPEDDSGNQPDTDAKFGDIDLNGELTKDDAIYLLRCVVFPDKYPLTADGDIFKDGVINKDDAIYLLRHIVFPDKYPLP